MWGTLNPFPFFTGGSQPTPAQRYILTLNGVNSYIDTGQRIVDVDNLDGLTLEGVFDLDSAGTLFAQTDGANVIDREFQIFILSGIELTIGGTRQVIVPQGAYPQDKGKLIKFEFNNSSVTVSVDGVVVAPNVNINIGLTREPNVNFWIGARGNGAGIAGYLKSGVIRDVKVNDGSVYNYPIDDNSTTVIRNAATVLGAEQVGNVTAEGDYSLSGNTYTLNRPDSQTGGQLRLPLVNGTYLVELEVVSGNNVAIRDSTSVVINPAKAGRNPYIVQITNGELRVNNVAVGVSCQIILHSVRLANGYATPINVTPSMWSLENA